MKIVLKNIAETEKLAALQIKKMEHLSKTGDEAILVCLFGNLGAGKTAWVKAIAKSLGIKEHITSPTFVILKNYNLNPKISKTFKKLVHIDAYRLEIGKELLSLGWNEILKEKGNIIFLEWPEKVSEILPPTSVKIYLKHLGETQREIEIKWPKKTIKKE